MIIKVCGIMNIADANFALSHGVDWIGLNLVGGPRRIALHDALAIISAVVDPARCVPLVMLHQPQPNRETIQALRDAGIARLQLYGQVTPESLREIRNEGMASIRVRSIAGEPDIHRLDEFLLSCRDGTPEFIVLDAPPRSESPADLGGTGRLADWSLIEQSTDLQRILGRQPWMLAGGLNAGNVTDAIRRLRPHGVDVCSGVESTKTVKDPARIMEFVQMARKATVDTQEAK